ncbi:MAG: hypothetical protein QM802_24865 [Agriterribacter sp.]
MKKLICICAISVALYATSCKKDEAAAIALKQTSQAPASGEQLIYWDDLPDEYKNAIPISSGIPENESNVAARNNNEQDEVFNPFTTFTGTSFSIQPPTEPIGIGYKVSAAASTNYIMHRIGIGKGTDNRITYITIWYKTPGNQSLLYVASSGGNTTTPMVSYTFSADEYITGFSGYSNISLKQLTIRTSKFNAISVGNNTGTTFNYYVTRGSYIGQLSGTIVPGVGINQLKATSYFKPWEKVSDSDAKEIDVDTSGTAYMVNATGNLYQMTSTQTAWSRVTGAPAGVIKVAVNIGFLYVITNDGKIHMRNGNEWSLLPGNDAKDITVTGQGVVFKINNAGGIYQYSPINSNWSLIVAGNFQSLTTGSVYNLKVVGTDGKIYVMGNGSLHQMPGSDGRDIDTGYEGELWLTNSAGKINVMQYPLEQWKEIAGTDAVRMAVIPGKAMMINTTGAVYRMIY